MRYFKLGNTDMEVSAVGYGCMGLSHASGEPTERNEAIRLIRSAVDMGYSFFDTAQCYNGVYADGSISCNEELVGAALKDVRSHVVIATKFGVQFTDTGLAMDSRPETIRNSVEESLKRLRTDYIDLYYQHRVDPNVPEEEVAGVMTELISEGKIRAWGISMADEDVLRRAHKVCPVTAIQNVYTLLNTKDSILFPVLRELDISFVSCCPLWKGLFSGAYNEASTFEDTDFRSRMKQFTKEGYEESQPVLKLLSDMAEEKGATMAQVALAWMIDRGGTHYSDSRNKETGTNEGKCGRGRCHSDEG